MWRIEGAERAKKMHQDDGAEFIGASFSIDRQTDAVKL